MNHYSGVVMSVICVIVYSSVYSGADQRKHQSSASLPFVREITGEFPAQWTSNVENVSISWRHHVSGSIYTNVYNSLVVVDSAAFLIMI